MHDSALLQHHSKPQAQVRHRQIIQDTNKVACKYSANCGVDRFQVDIIEDYVKTSLSHSYIQGFLDPDISDQVINEHGYMLAT